MTVNFVLDASAVLAWLWREEGFERVEALLAAGYCRMSSVNLSEVIAKALDRGLPPEQVDGLVSSLDLEILPFEAGDALDAARLRPPTRRLGLSLGDRACLALAKARGATAVTADRTWVEVSQTFGIEILCIRGTASPTESAR